MKQQNKVIFSINGSVNHCGVDEYTLILEKALSDNYEFIHMVRKNSDICKILKKNGSKIVYLEKNLIKTIITLKKTYNKLQPYYIIIHTAKEYFLIFFYKLFFDSKIILVRHNSYKLNYFPNLFFLKMADLIITPSYYCANVLKSQFPEFSSKIRVIYNTIDKIDDILSDNLNQSKSLNCSFSNDIFAFENITDNFSGKKIKKITLGFLGRITKQKGIELLIDVLKELKELDSRVYWKLLVGGKFDSISYENYIKKMVELKELSQNIVFLGFIEDKKKFFDSIDICVIPSLNAVRETFGLVAIESIKNEKPVIAMSSGALNEILSYGPSATICFNETFGALAKTILLLKDERLRQKYVKNGTILLKTIFSVERFSDQYKYLLDNLI
ncbi:MAG: glycosyltransferase family 4 protein [Exilispira sp.]